MKTLKTKFILFGLSAAVIVSVFMSSCEQEIILTDDVTTYTEENRQSYIIMLQTDNEEKAKPSRFKGKSRKEAVKIAQRMQNDFRTKANSALQKRGIKSDRVKDYYENIEGLNMLLTADEATELGKDPLVKSIELDRKFETNLPDTELQTTEKITTKLATDLPAVYNAFHGGYHSDGSHKSTWIWILDTGIDLDHPELNVITDNFYAKSFIGNDDPDDCHGHGTKVAGAAAARANGRGSVGMSEGAKLVPLQVIRADDCIDDYVYTSTVVSALNHVYSRSIPGDVVNMSLGFKGTMLNSMKTIMDKLNARSVYMVMAAGNYTDDVATVYPASYNNTYAITVGNMGTDGKLAPESNYGAGIDYVATGVSAYTTDVNGGYGTASGTSISAGVVSGIIHATAGNPMPGKLIYDKGEHYVAPSLWP